MTDLNAPIASIEDEGCQNECEPGDPDCEYCCLVAAENKWRGYAS